jgi:anti-anti-sigma factor
MPSHPCHTLLEAAAVEGTAAVRILPQALDEVTAQAVGEQLLSLADGLGGGQLYLDLGNVRYLTSTMLAKLLALHKKLSAAGGRLRLHNLTPCAYEIFEVTRLTGVLDVCQDRLNAGCITAESA